MEQNLYFEITDVLLKKGECHIREMAKLLQINHMTIYRKTNDLAKWNIIAFNQRGRNKTISLKKSLESEFFAYMTEHYKLIKLIKRYPLLRKTIDRIRGDVRYRLAVLFGSYAKFSATKDSDIDLYIESEDLAIKKELQMIDSKLSIKLGKYNKKNLLVREIEKNHVIIKGVEEFYEKSGFFDKT